MTWEEDIIKSGEYPQNILWYFMSHTIKCLSCLEKNINRISQVTSQITGPHHPNHSGIYCGYCSKAKHGEDTIVMLAKITRPQWTLIAPYESRIQVYRRIAYVDVLDLPVLNEFAPETDRFEDLEI